jgi:hypothetical protein
MTFAELRLECFDATTRFDGTITLVLPGVRKGISRRLFGKCGPLGEVMCNNHDGDSVCRFKAAAVLDYIDKARRKGQL